MKTLITIVLFVTLFIAGCASDTAGEAQQLPPEETQTAEPPAVSETAPQVTPEVTPEVTPDVSPSVTPEVTPSASPDPTVTPTEEVDPEPTAGPKPNSDPASYDYTLPVGESEAVKDSWFEDAVFIGDSRTDGLRLYSGMKGVDVLCYKGLTVFEVMEDKPVVQTADGKVGVLEGLGQKQYAKVYLSLGVNELGYNYDQGYADTYNDVVEKIKELQPEADIYLQLLIPVNEQKCQEKNQPDYVTNRQIDIYNEIIRTVAEQQRIYFLNVGEIFVDETGQLYYDASSDGVHFHKQGYRDWYDYLKTHTVKEGIQ